MSVYALRQFIFQANQNQLEFKSMNREELKNLLVQRTDGAERHPGCPPDAELACFLEGGLGEQSHHALITHFADCSYCLERIGMLGRARETELPQQVPDMLLARSRKLAETPQSGTGRKHTAARLTRWAAAAAILLAVGLVILQPPRPGVSPAPVEQSADQFRSLRNIESGAVGPRILQPRDGMTISSSQAVFNWSSVPDSIYYHVRIVSDEGDLIWRERVEGTQWGIPTELALSPDSEYYVRVDAFLADAKSLNSDFVAFRVGRATPK